MCVCMYVCVGPMYVCMCVCMQARSQPARWGGLNLDGWNTRRPPPLGHCPRDVINLKNAPTLGHSQAPPPLGHCPCDVIHIFQGWNKIAKGWNKIAERWNKIAKGWNKIFGMGNWGGASDPPTPPPPSYGPGMYVCTRVSVCIVCMYHM